MALVSRSTGGVAGALTPPAVPASTVAATNAFGVAVLVTVRGGTVTVVSVGGTTIGTTGGTFLVPAGSTIAITYSVAPTWTWYGLA